MPCWPEAGIDVPRGTFDSTPCHTQQFSHKDDKSKKWSSIWLCHTQQFPHKGPRIAAARHYLSYSKLVPRRTIRNNISGRHHPRLSIFPAWNAHRPEKMKKTLWIHLQTAWTNTFKALMRGAVNAIDRPGIQRIAHQGILAQENVDAHRWPYVPRGTFIGLGEGESIAIAAANRLDKRVKVI